MKDRFIKKDEDLLMLSIKETAFFKEHMRNAWSTGRRFKKDLFLKREENMDIKDIPDEICKFEEWFSKHYKG